VTFLETSKRAARAGSSVRVARPASHAMGPSICPGKARCQSPASPGGRTSITPREPFSDRLVSPGALTPTNGTLRVRGGGSPARRPGHGGRPDSISTSRANVPGRLRR